MAWGAIAQWLERVTDDLKNGKSRLRILLALLRNLGKLVYLCLS